MKIHPAFLEYLQSTGPVSLREDMDTLLTNFDTKLEDKPTFKSLYKKQMIEHLKDHLPHKISERYLSMIGAKQGYDKSIFQSVDPDLNPELKSTLPILFATTISRIILIELGILSVLLQTLIFVGGVVSIALIGGYFAVQELGWKPESVREEVIKELLPKFSEELKKNLEEEIKKYER